MAGRGRGRRLLSFSVDSAAISRGEPLPPTTHLPTPVFPVMEQKPLPLTGGEEVEYLLALKQDFRGAMRSLPCFIQPTTVHKDVERYSDKYHAGEQTDDLKDWILDWKRFPKELRVHVTKARKADAMLRCSNNTPLGQKKKKKKVREKEEVLLKLETLEKKEEQETSEEEGQEKNKQEVEAEEEEYDEEEFEEETDYIMSYFDNGEDFGGDSDDNMDEAIY